MAAPQSNGTAGAPQVSESEHFSPYRPDGKLYGFVCIVIGADYPIGKAVINELATHGAACIYACTLDSSSTSASATASASAPDAKIIQYPYAPTEEGTLQLVDDVLNAHGRLDIWVTLSPPSSPKTIAQTTPGNLSKLFESYALVPFYALKYAPPAMQKLCRRGTYANAAPKDTRYGSIVVVGSAAGDIGVGTSMVGNAALGVVKAGVKELKDTGVRINAIAPGRVEGDAHQGGDSTSVKKVGKAVEVARVVGFLASGFSSYVTGSEIVVDGGASALAA